MQYNITYRTKDKGWQYIISYKDIDGKWKQKSKQGFRSKKEAKPAAEKMLEELKKKLDLKADLNAEHEGISFKDFTSIFIEHERLYKEENTIIAYLTAFKNFSSLNELELNKIKSIHIQKCVDELIKRGLKSITIKRYLSRIDVLFKNARDKHKIIVSNPIINIDIPKDKNKVEKTALTKDELEMLLSKIKNEKYYLISLLASKCGLRLGEILGLIWSDIDDRRQVIKVNRQWKKLKDKTVSFGELKSKNSNREIPCPSIVLNTLNRYKSENPININNRIFDICSIHGLSTRLKSTYSSLGFNISIHELRHTYATTLIANGLDIKTVAKLLGHSVDMTIHTYSHVTDDMLNIASRLINNIF